MLFAPWVTKVYGGGGRPLPVGAEMLISGARDTLEEMTTSGADGQRKVTVFESYREELRCCIPGGTKGHVTQLVSRIFGVSAGTVARGVTERGDGKAPRKKIRSQERRGRTFRQRKEFSRSTQKSAENGKRV